MKVLGLSPLDKDSTVTLVEDGAITYAAAEERFTRVKLQDGFPWNALDSALKTTGTQIGEIDRVVYPFLTFDEETRLFERNLVQGARLSRRRRGGRDGRRAHSRAGPRSRAPGSGARAWPIRTSAWRRACSRASRTASSRARASCRATSPSAGPSAGAAMPRRSTCGGSRSSTPGSRSCGLNGKLKRVEHHVSHAANAFFTSGYDQALIVTLDGYGSGLSGSVSIGRDGRIERIHDQEYPHSLGTFYESVTSALGFQPSRHEGKIVGLAAYGDPAVLGDILRRRFVQNNGGFRIVETNNIYFAQTAGDAVPEDRRRGGVPAGARGSRHRVRLAVRAQDGAQQPRAVRRRRRQRQAEPAAPRDRGRRADLHPSEHGRRRLRHRRRAAGVCRPAQTCAGGSITSISARRSRAARSLTRSPARSCRSPNTSRSSRRSRCCWPRRQGRGALRRAHGIRPAGARPPIDSLPREGARREPVAEPAAGPHGVHAVRAGDALRASRGLLPEHRRRRLRRRVHDADVRLHGRDDARLSGRGPRGRHGAAAARVGASRARASTAS